jgi:hypothetical protein
MTIIFDNEITEESVVNFCNEVANKIYSLSEDDKIDIYFATNGGYNHFRDPIKNTLIKYQNYINLYINFDMLSNGFILLMDLHDVDYPITMTKDFQYAMIHKTDSNLNIERKNTLHKLAKEHIKKYNKQILKRLKKLKISDKNLLKYERGKDIHFDRKQVLKLFKNIKEEK